MWNISIISPVSKKGSKTKPENYRGISLLSCLGKFFPAILNQRLTKFINEKPILAKAQLGFIAGNRTSDNPRRVSVDWTDVYDTHNIEHRTEPVSR